MGSIKALFKSSDFRVKQYAKNKLLNTLHHILLSKNLHKKEVGSKYQICTHNC